MFDLIKAKYEPPEPIEMRLPRDAEAPQNIVTVRQRTTPNYALLALNLILLICSISLIVYGAIHFNECPAQKNIAIGYITMGVFFLASRLLNIHHEFLEAMGRTNVPPKSAVVVWLTLIIQIILLGIFFAICYWVYSIKPYIDENPRSPMYCEDDYYKNVFWGTTIACIGIVVVIILTCVTICYIRSKKREEQEEDY